MKSPIKVGLMSLKTGAVIKHSQYKKNRTYQRTICSNAAVATKVSYAKLKIGTYINTYVPIPVPLRIILSSVEHLATFPSQFQRCELRRPV